MPSRQLTLALLWLALAALLVMLGLLWQLRGQTDGWLVDAALLVNLLLLTLPPLCARRLCQRRQPARATQAAAAARTRFLAQFSHEIRTPMNAIMGMTQLALQTPLSAEQRELLGKTDAASRALLRLVNDVLDIAKIESGHVQIDTAPLRLEDVVAEAIERVRPLHTRPEVGLVCDWADPSLLAERGQLRGDAPRLQQVLVNLLGNALRSTAAGQVLLRLDAEATEADQVPLIITVRDSGIGMSADQLAGLNRTAGHGDAAAAPRADGGSLGLSIARSLLLLMGGRLAVQSQPGQGSSFEIRLRLPLHVGAPLAPLAPLPARRLLLADANADSREATLTLLRQLGQGEGLVAAKDADALLTALTRQTEQPFDWLLLDWQLPGPTGADLLARLRRDHPALRVAVLGQAGQHASLAQARVFGARALCAKPLLPGELRQLLGDTPSPAAATADGEVLAGLRVLLVEDHPTNQEVALRLLASRGALVDVAANGQLGLERLAARGAHAYDLVLMDLQMPVMGGLEATRCLREMPGFEDLPVLAMTAHTQPEERAECLAAGMQGHIAKPLDVAVLVRELQRYRQPARRGSAPPVLDLHAGLRQFAGQSALYQRTLRGFAEQYSAGLSGWGAWLASGDWPELRRAAHTLQGLAATVGAQPLQRQALALERCAAAADAPGAEQQLTRSQALLERLLEEIRQSLPERTPPQPGGAGDLAELRRLLADSDSRALDWWQAHGRDSGLDAATRQRLQQALDALDFDAAALALRESA